MVTGQLYRQTATTEQLYRQLVVPNFADRGSGVGQTNVPKCDDGAGVGDALLSTV